MKATLKKPSPYGSIKFKTIDEYHSSYPKNIRDILESLRKTIIEAAPNAEEIISYNVPAFKFNKVLVYYAAHKEHIGFYPTSSPIAFFKEELTKYKTSKGAIQFQIASPLPTSLIKKMVKFRIKQVLEKATPKKKPEKKSTIYHKDGTIWAKGKMDKGEPQGYWEWYRKSGIIMRSGYFDKSKQVGEWITYDKQGKVYKITKMKTSK